MGLPLVKKTVEVVLLPGRSGGPSLGVLAFVCSDAHQKTFILFPVVHKHYRLQFDVETLLVSPVIPQLCNGTKLYLVCYKTT